MNERTLKGHKRDKTGTSESRRLRKEGKIPAVIYGKEKPIHIVIDAKEFNSIVGSIKESSLLNIKIGRKSHAVLIKDFQERLLSDDISHLDFFEVTKGEVVHTHVPIVLEGASIGVKEGGLLEQVLHEVEIECLPKNLPETITVDISNLRTNESIHIKSMVAPKGVKFLTSEERTVVAITSQKAEKPEEEEEVEEETSGEASEGV